MSSLSTEFKKGKTMNLLNSLKRYTTVVADTGDIEAIASYKPQDATTNPSLLYQAAQMPQYGYLIEDALRHASRSRVIGRPHGRVHGQAAGQLRLRNPQDHTGPGLHRSRCRL